MNGSLIDNSESILNEKIINYSYQLVELTINKSEDIDKLIIKLKNWDLKRLALIDKLILRLH